MKTIGLIGGMSWESTALYYQLLNEGVRDRLGGLHSAKILLHSVNFAEIEQMQVTGQWRQAGEDLAAAARGLQLAGADVVLICSNLMHKVAPIVAAAIKVPLLHIADATGTAIERMGIKKVGLLGTRYTMEEKFYRQRISDSFGIEVMIPEEDERNLVHRVIFDELCCGNFVEGSRNSYVQIIDNLHSKGAEGVILGCTEISLLVKPEHTDLPLFDSSALHVDMVLEYALK